MTTKEMLKKWNNGKKIDSVSMGGLVEGYENAIQQNIFPLCEKIVDIVSNNALCVPALSSSDEIKSDDNDFWNSEYDKLLSKQIKGQGLSGAQAGAIKTVAWQFAKYGYDYMMKSAPKDRIIKVKKEI